MKQARLQKRLTIATMFVAAGCAAFVLRPQIHAADQEAALPAVAAAAAPAPSLLRLAADASPAPARRVYPYSIVPGGVSSRAELAQAVMADKVVAAHYAGFAVDKASPRTVAKARAVYVSYRKGEQVYWTARRVTLAEGESILSDGQNDIRARCGNRISDTPQLPVEAKGPDEQELDTPAEPIAQAGDGALREVAFDLDVQDNESRPFVSSPVPNGAGLLAVTRADAAPAYAAQVQAGFGIDQASLRSLLATGGRQDLLATGGRQDLRAGVTNLASGLVSSSAAGSAADGGATTGAATAAAANSSDTGGSASTGTGAGRIVTASLSSTRTSDTAMSGSGDGTGAKPAGSDSSADTANPPARNHELPEPDSLWLAGVAAAALLLQRRLRPRRPR